MCRRTASAWPAQCTAAGCGSDRSVWRRQVWQWSADVSRRPPRGPSPDPAPPTSSDGEADAKPRRHPTVTPTPPSDGDADAAPPTSSDGDADAAPPTSSDGEADAENAKGSLVIPTSPPFTTKQRSCYLRFFFAAPFLAPPFLPAAAFLAGFLAGARLAFLAGAALRPLLLRLLPPT